MNKLIEALRSSDVLLRIGSIGAEAADELEKLSEAYPGMAADYEKAKAYIADLQRQLAEAKFELDGCVVIRQAAQEMRETNHELRRQLDGAKAEIEAMRPFTSLILSGPDGETLVISSDIEPQTDGSFRFTVTSPISGRRFGVVCGITELRKQP